MTSEINVATILIDPILLAIAVIYVYGFTTNITKKRWIQQAIMGLTFGLGAMFAMLTAILFSDGIIIDMRSLLVGLSGAFFGIPGAVITGLISGLTRLYIGGDGVFPGIIGILMAAAAGPLWAKYVRNKLSIPALEHLALGLMISVHLVAVVTFPAQVMWRLIFEIVPILILLNVVGSVLIGWLLSREEGLAQENQDLINAATTDPLTRLHNRRSAVAAYEKLPPPKAENQGTAMLCFDVDNFKLVNDTHGHAHGDAVLSEISTRIGCILRPTDVFSRLGGDEFLIILPSVTLDETSTIAERCREVIAMQPVAHEGHAMNVTISVGAEWMPDRPDFMTFVASADEALYQAKKLGRNCVAFAWQNATNAAQAMSHPAKLRRA